MIYNCFGHPIEERDLIYIYILKVKVMWSRYNPGVAQRVDRGIALLFPDRGTRRGWVVNSTPRLHFIPGKDPVLIVQEAGWDPGSVWTGGKSHPHRDSIPDLPARSQSLYRLSYWAPYIYIYIYIYNSSKVPSRTLHAEYQINSRNNIATNAVLWNVGNSVLQISAYGWTCCLHHSTTKLIKGARLREA